MTTIHAITNDQVLSAVILPKVACNNQNTVRLHVEFDDSWSGYAKSAVFYTSSDPTPYEVIFSAENNCDVPPEVLAKAGILYIGVKGVDRSGGVKTTAVINYKILPGTPTAVISDPTPDVYKQILSAWGDTDDALRHETEQRITADNAYKTALQNEIAVERARLDLVQSGATADDAELIDVRVGADAKTYNTAGAAVRSQLAPVMQTNGCTNPLQPLLFDQAYMYRGSGITNQKIFDTARYNMIDLAEYKAIEHGGGTSFGIFGKLVTPLPVFTSWNETDYVMIVKADKAFSALVAASYNPSWGSTTIATAPIDVAAGYNVIKLKGENFSDEGHDAFRYIGIYGIESSGNSYDYGELNAFEAYVLNSDALSGWIQNEFNQFVNGKIKPLYPNVYASDASFSHNYSVDEWNNMTVSYTKKASGYVYAKFPLDVFDNYIGKNVAVYIRNESAETVKGIDVLFTVLPNWSDSAKVKSVASNVRIAAGETVAAKLFAEENAAWKGQQAFILVRDNGAGNIGNNVNIHICVTAENSSDIFRQHSLSVSDVVFISDAHDCGEIVCWGDSLTAQGGWTGTLAELSGMSVLNAGTGGENSDTIIARQGADVMMVDNLTIPANKTAVHIASYIDGIKTEFGRAVRPLLQGGTAHVNPVMIGDVEGTLAWTGSAYNDVNGSWTFTRSAAGDAVKIDRPTAIRTAYDREKNAPHLMIIFIGTNDGEFNVEDMVNRHKLMIAHAHADNVLVLGLSRVPDALKGVYENAMRSAFGRNFLSLREYMVKYGLADQGLTATDADDEAIENGDVPPQLLSDAVHYTSATRTMIGKLIYKRCCELGIF